MALSEVSVASPAQAIEPPLASTPGRLAEINGLLAGVTTRSLSLTVFL